MRHRVVQLPVHALSSRRMRHRLTDTVRFRSRDLHDGQLCRVLCIAMYVSVCVCRMLIKQPAWELGNYNKIWRCIITLLPVGLRSIVICGQRINCVCLFVGLSVCLSARIHFISKNHTSKFRQIFCSCELWPWLGPSLMAMRYVMYFRFCRRHHVFIYNAGNGPESEQVAAPGEKSAVSDCIERR